MSTRKGQNEEEQAYFVLEYGHHKSRRQDSSRERSPSATSKYVESEGRLAKTTDGKSAGLQTLAAHREEMEQLKEIEEVVDFFIDHSGQCMLCITVHSVCSCIGLSLTSWYFVSKFYTCMSCLN